MSGKLEITATALEVTISTDDVNSQAFFDHQFEIGEWERNNGPAQTRYFTSQIVAGLPALDREYLSVNAASILDWGCALGDGVDVLKRAFPQCAVIGQDFSSEAIKRAQRIYPQYEFIVGEKIVREFDVIVVSNCLEHFSDPLRVAETHMACCRAMYVVLVPFLEEPLMPGHLARFSSDTFPLRLGGWTRVAARSIEMDGRYWNGKQLLVVYGSESYLEKRTVLSGSRETAAVAGYAPGRDGAGYVEVESSREWNGWLDHPTIVEHYRRRALVDGRSWPEFVRRQLGGPAERSLDLGCGDGARSFAVYNDGVAASLEGLDIRKERIELAEQARLARGIPGDFKVLDSNVVELPANHYQLIFSCHSFHHFLRLEHIMAQVHHALVPSGLFVLEEYVGPSQFQWTDEQIGLVRDLMALLPERLRRLPWGAIKSHEGRPTQDEVAAESPFDSARSAEILPIFEKHFEIVARRKLGGTVQQLLYNGIIRNFQLSDPDAVSSINAVMQVEDALIDNEIMPSDFVLIIGRRKHGAQGQCLGE